MSLLVPRPSRCAIAFIASSQRSFGPTTGLVSATRFSSHWLGLVGAPHLAEPVRFWSLALLFGTGGTRHATKLCTVGQRTFLNVSRRSKGTDRSPPNT